MKHLACLLLAFSLLLPALAEASPRPTAASLLCGQSAKGSLRVLCEDPELAAMHREIAALYDRSLAVLPPNARHDLIASQQRFAQRRDDCTWAAHHSAHPGVAVEECLRTVLEGRVRSLRQVADRGRP